MFPAHAGMTRIMITRKAGATNVPRPRGDDPGKPTLGKVWSECSPPTRG